MQLDQTRVVIRERNYLDILDLALRVCRVYAGPLTAALALGAAPAMALNAWLLAAVVEVDFSEAGYVPYMSWMLVLVLWEMPLVTAPLTLYLGAALFTDRPRARDVLREWLHALPQMVFYQGILRAPLILFWLTWFFPFAAWPYLGEVILLERNPLRARRPGQMTTWRRRKALHEGFMADLFSRWLGSVAVGTLLFASVWLAMLFCADVLLGEDVWESAAFTVWFPLALWSVVGYFTVVRFLAYLDLRIRREGWEVELLLRAEQTRVTRQLT